MPLLFVVVVIAIVAGVAVLVVRDRPVVDDDPVDARRLVWPPADGVGPDDVESARFTVALRGYRMDEVDRVLADVGVALAERDARIAALESAQGIAARPGADELVVPGSGTPASAAAGSDIASPDPAGPPGADSHDPAGPPGASAGPAPADPPAGDPARAAPASPEGTATAPPPNGPERP